MGGQDELADGPVPQLVGDTTAINFEQIAALAPDLILVGRAGPVFVYSPEDARGRFMAGLGFVDQPEISALAGDA
jgi:ABC-type Fe3+-hydroxamate transport system substrate-binding protein